MRDRGFEALVGVAVCLTVGAVAVQHGLSRGQIALWVAVAVAAGAGFELALLGVRRLLPRMNPLQQINLAATAVSAATTGILVVVEAVEGSGSTAAVAGAACAAFASIAAWILLRAER